MLQNFKADIIYYNTQTDFELEFNLCGCCRMRLLNDKCSDKKTLLLSLSRAVSRSRVIIITAPLFNGDSITKTIATSIGSTAEKLDNSAYNVVSDNDIDIIKGSTPLVTGDGIFGGCIIASGPQTLILLTDNKSVRKNIMKTLIHPYIEELATSDAPQSQAEPQDHNQIITEPDLPEENEETYEEVADELEEMLVTDEAEEMEETEGEELEESALIFESEDDSLQLDEDYYSDQVGLYTETEKEDSKASSENASEDDDDYYDDYYIDDSAPQGNRGFNISLLIISIILLLAIAVLCICIFLVPQKSGVNPAVYLQEIYDVMFK